MVDSGSLNPASVFVEAYHPQQRIEDGVAFPKILSPQSVQQADLAALVQGIKSSSQWLEQELERHSAILFRGFSVQTAEDFAAVSRAFGWKPLKYEGIATRREVLSGIYTANEGPLEAEIWLHHEMAHSETFPSKIIFFCEVEPSKAGETIIALSHKAAEQIQMQFPAFMEKLESHGVLSTVYLPSQDNQSSVIGKGWQALLHTTDETEAERRIACYQGRIEWQPDKTAKVMMGPFQVTTAFREDGRKVWFRNIATHAKILNSTTTYGDGSDLPAEEVNGCIRILQELVVEIPWRQGDVMVLDNLAILHGRRAAQPPRRILVSLNK